MKIIRIRDDSKPASWFYAGRFLGLAEDLAFSDFNHYQLTPKGRPVFLFIMVNSKVIIGYKYENFQV